ncbi:MAG: alanine racemase [Candidatus Cloacimonetes bacterium]|nr:alanine racemase [Candidatus Cloacimonadota bacterium]
MKQNISERSWVEIDLAAFRKNLQFLKGYLKPQQDFLQIVKADAYGHGAKEIAEAALAEGAVYLGVANLEEGKLLRIQGIDAPILILSPSLPNEIDEIIKYNLVPAVSNMDFALKLSKAALKAEHWVKIHIKIDTGMHRSGCRSDKALSFLEDIAALPSLEIEGIFSHFSSAENDPDFSRMQERLFRELIDRIPRKIPYVHIANSAGLISGKADFCNLVRLGIFSFGIDSIGTLTDSLTPVMTFKSSLSQIKEIKLGESVGYQREWIAPRDGHYGIIPIGYADGYDFLLSNKGKVLVSGCICPVIGRISMDMISIDLSAVPKAKCGDEVVLLGNDHPELRVENLAALYNGSAYALLCQVGRRARRFFKTKDHILHSAPLARRDFIAADFGDSKLNQIISSALAKRLQSDEIGDLIYREILRTFFYNKDRDVHYRRGFIHEIRFSDSDNEAYFKADTRLRYSKVLESDYFIVACAASDEILRGYFMRKDVEYRWLLDPSLILNTENFKVNSVKVNGLSLSSSLKHSPEALEIRCSHPDLEQLRGKELEFEINTSTLYPKSSHQLSVFISELTRGVEISFSYPKSLGHVEPVSIFSGQQKNPLLSYNGQCITLKTKADEWIFPLSGVVFTY